MSSPDPDANAHQTVFNSCPITGPIIQTVSKDSSTVIYNFRGPDDDELEAAHNTIQTNTSIAEGTGSWLYGPTADSPAADLFRQFRDDIDLGNATLLCSAYPLVGKTILASVVKQHLANLRASFLHQSATAVSALYLGHHLMKGRSFRDVRLRLLENLAWQCRGSGPHHRAFDKIKRIVSQQTKPTDDEVMECFTKICHSLQVFYIVVDAMDECACSERQQLMHFLNDLQSTHGAKIRLFITCRPMEDIASAFPSCNSFQLQAHDDDIARFVHQQVGNSDKISGWVKQHPNIDLPFRITSAVLAAAGRHFWVATRQVEILKAQSSYGAFLKTMDNLPHITPFEDYRERVKSIREVGIKNNCNTGLKILMWVFFSEQSTIKLRTLQYALALSRDALAPPTEMDLIEPIEIVRLTQGFVNVDEAAGTVFGYHHTAYTYFKEVRWLDFEKAADLIISRSIRHLSFYSTAFFTSEAEFLDHPFTRFAMAQIPRQIKIVESHAELNTSQGQAVVPLKKEPALTNMSSTIYQRAEVPSSTDTLETLEQIRLSRRLYQQCLEMLHNKAVLKLYFRQSPDAHKLYGEGQSRQSLMHILDSPLHFAALLGSQVLTETLVKDTRSINCKNSHQDTALAVAMKLGHDKVVKVLLGKGAFFDLRRHSGWEVLLHTMSQDHDDIAQDMLQKAAKQAAKKILSSIRESGVLLLKSVYDGHSSELSSALKRCNRHPDLTRLLGTALLIAVDRQHHDMIDIVLDSGAMVDAIDQAGNAALHHAARRNNPRMVSILILKGASVDLKNKLGRTPWQTIGHLQSHLAVSRLLLDSNADVNTRDWEGVSTLYRAAAGGHVHDMRLLLEAGTDPDIRTAYGWQPLHWAAGNGHLEATRLLLDWNNPGGKTADVNCLSDTTETPLDRATASNHSEVIELLKERGALTGREVCGLPVVPLRSIQLSHLRRSDPCYPMTSMT